MSEHEGNNKPALTRALTMLGWALGLALVLLGAARIALPVETIPDSGHLSASLDTETRAGGVLLIGLGYAYIWAVRQPRPPTALLRALATAMAALALSRVISVGLVGMPHPILVAAAGAEALAAALTLWYSALGQDTPEHDRSSNTGSVNRGGHLTR